LLVTDTVDKALFSDPAIPLDFNLTQKSSSNIIIDGNLNDWKDAYPVHLRGDERNSTGLYVKNNLDAVAYTKWDADNFYIAVEVTDDIHKQSETPSNLWKNDSVQITIDPLNDKSTSYSSDDMEWGFALNNDGTKSVYIFSSNAPNPKGEVSGQVSFEAVRDEVYKKTYYEIKIPKSMINQFPAIENSLIGWDVLVNDADYQNGRDNFVNWTKGLGDSKNPSLYDTFKLVNIPYEAPKSTDATLSSLNLSGGYSVTPTFAPPVTSYTVTVPNSISDLSITPTVASSVYKSIDVTLNGTSVIPVAGVYLANLIAGTNTLAITVTVEDGVTTMTYSITITRSAEPPKSTDATLSGLSLSVGYSVTPAFAPNVTSYTLTVADLSITPTVASSVYKSMDVTLNGTSVIPVAGVYTANLIAGTNTLAITVTAEDGTTTMTYNVTITREQPPKSTDATLSSLSLSGGYSVTPAFAPNVTSYTVTVPNSASNLSITPTVASSVYKSIGVTLNGTSVIPVAGVYTVNLIVGTNTLAITVTAEDGTTTMTYNVTITRE
jgi:hypothetical protein